MPIYPGTFKIGALFANEKFISVGASRWCSLEAVLARWSLKDNFVAGDHFGHSYNTDRQYDTVDVWDERTVSVYESVVYYYQ